MHTTNNMNDRMVNNNPFIPDVPFHLDPLLRPKQPIKQNITCKQNSQNKQNVSPNINFEENSPFQEGVMSETFQRLDKSFFQNPKELGDLINKGNFNPQMFTKTNGHRQNTRSSTEKGVKRHTFAYGS